MHTCARSAFALLSVVLATVAAACDAGEYAQYKDRARADPLKLAKAFCLTRDLWEIRRTGGDRAGSAQCSAEMTKMLDALSAVKSKAAISYIEKTCPIAR